LRLFNGDTGVTMAGGDEAASRVFVAFDDSSGQPRRVSPSRLGGVETVYAMTVHKSQGSEFNRVTLLLPPASSRLLTRELLYTAVTRAKRSLLVVGTEEAVRAAVNRPIARASGLTERLWRD
jgi:exodeoxyribonuclease V alpha subunit